MLQILCRDIVRVGSLKDGGKEICIDERYKPQAPCLVYSFGYADFHITISIALVAVSSCVGRDYKLRVEIVRRNSLCKFKCSRKEK